MKLEKMNLIAAVNNLLIFLTVISIRKRNIKGDDLIIISAETYKSKKPRISWLQMVLSHPLYPAKSAINHVRLREVYTVTPYVSTIK